jgi:hypothetical protein
MVFVGRPRETSNSGACITHSCWEPLKQTSRDLMSGASGTACCYIRVLVRSNYEALANFSGLTGQVSFHAQCFSGGIL